MRLVSAPRLAADVVGWSPERLLMGRSLDDVLRIAIAHAVVHELAREVPDERDARPTMITVAPCVAMRRNAA